MNIITIAEGWRMCAAAGCPTWSELVIGYGEGLVVDLFRDRGFGEKVKNWIGSTESYYFGYGWLGIECKDLDSSRIRWTNLDYSVFKLKLKNFRLYI